jgi:Glycosyltransferase like family 2
MNPWIDCLKRVSIMKSRHAPSVGLGRAFSHREWIPTVAVPARNEARRLPLLIRALSQQTWLRVGGRQLNVTIAVNNCDDDSMDVARAEASFHPNLSVNLINVNFPEHAAHVGSARRFAAETALAASKHSCSVLMTTDADAVPEPSWVENNLRAIEGGADAVGGFISADEREVALLGPKVRRRAARHLYYAKLADQLGALLDPLEYDPWPRHQDHTGASLAVRADVYGKVGGIPPLAFREDIAFVERIRAAGYRLRHALDVRVRVSARLDGRAQNGMSDCLKRWIRAESEGEHHSVEAPQAILERLIKRRRFQSSKPCSAFEANKPHSGMRAADSVGIPALGETFAQNEPNPVASISIEAAIAQMERMISNVDEFKVA